MKNPLKRIFKGKATITPSVASSTEALKKAITNKKDDKVLGSPLLKGFTKRYEDLENI